MSKAPKANGAELGADDPEVSLCAFYVGAQEYVLDLRRVDEVVQPPQVTAVPNAPFFVEGLMNWRGGIVPVIDLRKWLRSSSAARATCLICRMGSRRLAVLVDRLSDVVHLRKSQIRPLPSLVAPDANPVVIGACGPPNQLKLLLNLKALPRSASDAAGRFSG